jgi:hypothetical protein
MIPVNVNISAAVVALMVKKGGTLRLLKSELAEVGDLMLTVNANPTNPDVLHIGIMARVDYEAAQAVLKALQTPPLEDTAKEPDASAE